MQAVLTLMT
uniref:Uncharacterized protein n=1 Tax=Anguilla anguilla TaxID=7936 RepID=A0A0E9Q427_ANGAN